MKTRYRSHVVKGLFSDKTLLVLQVYRHIPQGPDDYHGLPQRISYGKWEDATIEDLQELLCQEQSANPAKINA